MRVGQARKRDANEKPICDDLVKFGYEVTKISGEGAPDILVNKRWNKRRVWAFEVKSDIGKQTDSQKETDWPIIRTLEDALREMGVYVPKRIGVTR